MTTYSPSGAPGKVLLQVAPFSLRQSSLPSGSRVARNALCHCSFVTAAWKICAHSCQLSAFLPESTSASQDSEDCCASCSGFCWAVACAHVARSNISKEKAATILKVDGHTLLITVLLWIELRSPPPLQLRQQPLDPIFFLKRGQPIFHVVSCDFGFSLTHSLRMRNLALHPVESRRFRAIADRKASVACLAHGAGATMLRNQQIGLGLRLRQLLLQLPQGGFQIFHLRLWFADLLREALNHLAITLDALQRSTCQVVLLLVNR